MACISYPDLLSSVAVIFVVVFVIFIIYYIIINFIIGDNYN